MDTQSKDTSKDDLQQTSIELPKVSISIFHRSGERKTPAISNFPK